MNRKLLLIAGIAAAAVALAVLHTWQAGVMEDYNPGAEVTVLVAGAPLEAGTRVRSEMFVVARLSEHFVARVPHAITPNTLSSVEGQALSRALAPGEILRLTDFGNGMTSGSLSQKVGKNLRAVPLPVDELNAFSGLLQPGDRVDILAYLPHPDTGKQVILSFLEDVEVLATGERMAPGGGFGRGGTVTLLLDRKSAADLSLAQRSGELVFLLRHPEDGEQAKAVDETSADSLLQPVPKQERQARPKRKTISVYSANQG